jgi:Domain of unknown function (DUF1906)
MTTYWGVDTAAPVDGHLYDALYATAKVYPSCWGRYLIDVPDECTGLTNAEVAYLLDRNVAIFPIYSGATENEVKQGYQEGWNHAQTAINAAYGLTPRIPDLVAIYLDIEASWNPTPDFLRGWAHNLQRANYYAGVYRNTLEGAFNNPYSQAVRVGLRIVIYASEPSELPGDFTGPPGPGWGAAAPSGYDANVTAWQYVEGVYKGQVGQAGVDLDLLTEEGYQRCWHKVSVSS